MRVHTPLFTRASRGAYGETHEWCACERRFIVGSRGIVGPDAQVFLEQEGVIRFFLPSSSLHIHGHELVDTEAVTYTRQPSSSNGEKPIPLPSGAADAARRCGTRCQDAGSARWVSVCITKESTSIYTSIQSRVPTVHTTLILKHTFVRHRQCVVIIPTVRRASACARPILFLRRRHVC